MKGYTRIVLTALFCGGIAIALSVLPRMEWLQGGDIGVFNSVAAIQLSDENLVDQLTELPLNLKIRRVDWAQSILSLDLEMSPIAADPSAAFEDLYALSYFGLTETRNVRRILVRVLLPKSDPVQNRLLLAMDADRERWKPLRPGDWQREKPRLEQWLSDAAHLQFTRQWSERFG